MTATRCTWPGNDPLMLAYHDDEWGVPVHDDRKHFEFLILEGAQAGLSWKTILYKREGYRKAFSDFDPQKVARFDARKVERLVLDASIIRNRQKIEAAIKNARAFLALQKEFGSFDAYCWRFVGGAPKLNRRRATVPCRRRHQNRMRSARISSSAASASWAPLSSTHTCKPSEWSTITSSAASATARSAGRDSRSARLRRERAIGLLADEMLQCCQLLVCDVRVRRHAADGAGAVADDASEGVSLRDHSRGAQVGRRPTRDGPATVAADTACEYSADPAVAFSESTGSPSSVAACRRRRCAGSAALPSSANVTAAAAAPYAQPCAAVSVPPRTASAAPADQDRDVLSAVDRVRDRWRRDAEPEIDVATAPCPCRLVGGSDPSARPWKTRLPAVVIVPGFQTIGSGLPTPAAAARDPRPAATPRSRPAATRR